MFDNIGQHGGWWSSPYGFLLRVGVLAMLPLLPFAVLYLWLDPFKVVRSHDDYFSDGLGVNKGVVTIDAFKRHNPEIHYNSFIVGASISCYYPVDEWLRYLPANARAMHVDSSGQPVHTMRLFMEYLDREADGLDNMLIVLSPYVLGLRYDPDFLPGAIPVDLKPTLNYLWDFHYRYFRSFSTYNYFASYIPWRLTGEKHDYTYSHLFEPQPIRYDAIINEETIPEWDWMIDNDPDSFYAVYPLNVADEQDSYVRLGNRITDDVKEDLEAIAEILKRRGSSYKVVLSPTSKLELLSDADDRFLHSLFGRSYHNLTMEFREEMSDRSNFYDEIHYRPVLARKYLRRIYEPTEAVCDFRVPIAVGNGWR